MRITKFGHACVRIEHDGAVVVIDPGVFTDPGAADGATAVLVTHEHADHWTADHLRSTDAPIWTTHAVADVLAAEAPDLAERVRRITPGETFDAGVPVTAVGELHAVIHEEIPRIDNSGYVLDVGGRRVYHPGDALTLPASVYHPRRATSRRTVDLLLAPVSAPWLKARRPSTSSARWRRRNARHPRPGLQRGRARRSSTATWRASSTPPGSRTPASRTAADLEL